jgi:hypothetical protein
MLEMTMARFIPPQDIHQDAYGKRDMGGGFDFDIGF